MLGNFRFAANSQAGELKRVLFLVVLPTAACSLLAVI
jgi:hypothetical protein